jgi:hypothetical protein
LCLAARAVSWNRRDRNYVSRISEVAPTGVVKKSPGRNLMLVVTDWRIV